jgi:hypothetical protein
VQNIRHQRLESHVFDSGNQFGRLKVSIGRVTSSFSRVVDKVCGVEWDGDLSVDEKPTMRWNTPEVGLTLGHLTQRSAFFSEINDESNSTPLSTLDGLLDPVNQVRSTRADIRTEHVGPVAFVVDSQGELFARVREVSGVAKDVHGETTDGREEDFEVGSSDEFGVHSAGF